MTTKNNTDIIGAIEAILDREAEAARVAARARLLGELSKASPKAGSMREHTTNFVVGLTMGGVLLGALLGGMLL